MKILLECLDKTNVRISVITETEDELKYTELVKVTDGNYEFLLQAGIKYLEIKNKSKDWKDFAKNKTVGKSFVIDMPDFMEVINKIEKLLKKQ